ncbi:MAG: PQQ-dependent sugar dehydrogenase [Verrucomicrobiota bacterium]
MCRTPRLIALFLLLSGGLGYSADDALGNPGLHNFPRWQGGNLVGAGIESTDYRAERLFSEIDWTSPTGISHFSGTKFLVTERQGKLFQLDLRSGERTMLLDLRERHPKGGLLLMSALPSNLPDRDKWILLRYQSKTAAVGDNFVSAFRYRSDGQLDPDSEEVLLHWSADGHIGGDMKWGSDGMLYVSSGDGGAPGDPNNWGQTTDTLLGSILRLKINDRGNFFAVDVPDDNPFRGTPGIRPEVFAYGLRNPWRMHFHRETGELWVGDNGDEHWEMVHRIESAANYGWSTYEGSQPFRPSNPLAGPTLVHTTPVVEHSHQEMRSVIGGFWYRGSEFPELANHYLYGCYVTGKVWAFPWEGEAPGTPFRLTGSIGQIVCFEEDPMREPIVLTHDGGLHRLHRAEERESRPLPSLLSETGLFESTQTHQLAEGLLPFEINAEASWNGSERLRFLGLPPGETIQIQRRPAGDSKRDPSTLRTVAGWDRWKYPDGTVIGQTFTLERGQDPLRVETQISMKQGGEWQFFTYRWRDDQSDAELVGESGDYATIEFASENLEPQELPWRFPARAECAACHTQRSMFVLSGTMAQLNREVDYASLGGEKSNQLATFKALGFFPERFRFNESVIAGQNMPNPHDRAHTLDERARSWLHVNCAHCHRETGVAGRASFELLHWLPLAETDLLDQKPAVGLPGPNGELVDSLLLAPGDPDRSEIYRRVANPIVGKMPMLGGTTLSEEEIALVRDWILDMDSGNTSRETPDDNRSVASSDEP